MRLFLILSLSILLPAIALAQGNSKVINAEELKTMIDKKKKVVIVDARTETEYREGHIPGAINIAPEKHKEIEQYLPKNKKRALIFYCRGTA
ncbi:MAG: rhodanese-like domain-containing protein [Nitrospirae bacterium]|nr:rhodanese-like domain-containing protein [Nitrospirota bacterium]